MSKGNEAICIECSGTFVKRRITQRFCSKTCKVRLLHREWVLKNPEAAAEIERRRNKKRAKTQAAASLKWRRDNKEYCAAMGSMRSSESWYKFKRTSAPWASLLYSAKKRAKKRGTIFSLSAAWAEERWTGRCELTGMEFALGIKHIGPLSPSIDEIRNGEGYTPENSRFILSCVNHFKGQMTDEKLFAVALELLKSRK